MQTGHRFSRGLSTGAGRSNFNPSPSPGRRRKAKASWSSRMKPGRTSARRAAKKTPRNVWHDLVQRSHGRNCETARPTIWFRGANAKRTATQKAPVQGHGLVVAPAHSASKSMTWRARRFAPACSTARVRSAPAKVRRERVVGPRISAFDLRRPLSTGLSGAANTSSFPKKPVKGVDGRLGNVMLNALRVRFRGLRWNADGQENLDHEPMT